METDATATASLTNLTRSNQQQHHNGTQEDEWYFVASDPPPQCTSPPHTEDAKHIPTLYLRRAKGDSTPLDSHVRHHSPHTVAKDDARPPFSYSQLISEAILSSPTKQCTLREIISYISQKYPYYKPDSKGWKNSIRHCLSLYKKFVKFPHLTAGSLWKIDPGFELNSKRKLYQRQNLKKRAVGISKATVTSVLERIKMQIFVRSGATHVLDLAEQQTVGDVRTYICQAEGLPEAEVRLYAAGSPLDNDALPLVTLPTDAIDVNVALKGGKVHGSLSRAGKVKGQTPKVEKKEKKKAKTGRAKRRIQYNRRFVNVVATFGKKRGPNSNS
nr:forkhead box protein C2-like isoform X3 [Procambarus clarkii]